LGNKVNLTTFIKCESTQIPTQMIRISNYVVVPSKLDQVLSYCNELSDELKEKVILITDIARLGKLLGNPPMSAKNFDVLMEMPIPILEAVQHNIQIEWNTQNYRRRVNSSLL